MNQEVSAPQALQSFVSLLVIVGLAFVGAFINGWIAGSIWLSLGLLESIQATREGMSPLYWPVSILMGAPLMLMRIFEATTRFVRNYTS